MTARLPPLPPAARDGVAHALAEQRAVGESGDRVVERLMGQLVLEDLALAHVTGVEDEAADVLVGQQVGEQDLELARAAVLLQQRALERLGLLVGGHRLGDKAREPHPVRLADEIRERAAETSSEL